MILSFSQSPELSMLRSATVKFSSSIHHAGLTGDVSWLLTMTGDVLCCLDGDGERLVFGDWRGILAEGDDLGDVHCLLGDDDGLTGSIHAFKFVALAVCFTSVPSSFCRR